MELMANAKMDPELSGSKADESRNKRQLLRLDRSA